MSTCRSLAHDEKISRSSLKRFEACASQLSRHGNVRKWTASVVSTELLSVIPHENPCISGL